MVVFGGMDSMSKRLRSTYVYDLKEQSWRKVPTKSIPGGRSNATLTAVFHAGLLARSDFSVTNPPKLKADFVLPEDGFYLFGGLNDDDVPTNDLSVLKMANGSLEWSEVPTYMRTPSPRYDHCAAFVQGNLIVCGGRNDSLYRSIGDSCLNDVHIFKLESRCWEEVTVYGAVPEGRWGHCSAVYGSKLFMVGGINHHTYLPAEVHVLETDQSYVTELVRQQAEKRRLETGSVINRLSMMFGGKLKKSLVKT
jgi:N-acetylneuraminic acid mutarotase